MKELKTIRDILQALLDGHEVEEKFEPQNTWESVNTMCFDARYLDVEEVLKSRYRIKPTKPSIDWSHVSDNYKFLVKNMNGSCFLYENRPKPESEDWWSDSGGAYTGCSAFKSLDAGNCDWRDSLVKRPDNEEKET